jgi:hypothetical protein
VHPIANCPDRLAKLHGSTGVLQSHVKQQEAILSPKQAIGLSFLHPFLNAFDVVYQFLSTAERPACQVYHRRLFIILCCQRLP